MGLAEDAAARILRERLEGDGVAVRLFELLWKKDLLSETSLALRIPDTVLFRYNAPSAWYFTSVDGTIKRKSKAKVNVEHIAEELLKKPSPSGIVAYYVKTTDRVVQEGGGLDFQCGSQTTIEYFDADGLRDFLFNRLRERDDGDGILQRFIEPKGGSNNMLRALWSPKVCLLERRVNRLPLHDTRYDVYERAVTFEGPDFHSQVKPVRGPGMVTKVHEIADSIVEHVAEVSGDRIRITRLALNFKVDDRDRLWLLFASSVRLRSDLQQAARSPRNAAEIIAAPLESNTVLRVPDHVRRACTISHAAPACLQQTRRCPTCESKAQTLFSVSYKVLLEYDEYNAGADRELPAPLCLPRAEVSACLADVGHTEPDAVPPTVQRLHPRLTTEEYARFRHDVAFLYRTADVCEACYLRFSAPQLGVRGPAKRNLPESVRTAAEDAPLDMQAAVADGPPAVGTQGLDPERLRLRRSATLQKISASRAQEEGPVETGVQRLREESRHSKSCPRLPSWWGHPQSVLPPSWELGPVLRARPPAPPGPAHARMELPTVPSASSKLPAKVPPLQGDPYLRELQRFTTQCGDRAGEVLGARAANLLLRSCSPYRAQCKAAKSRPPRPAPGETIPEGRDAPSDAQVVRGGERSARLGGGLPTVLVDVPEDDADSIMEDLSDDENPIVAQIWEQWSQGKGKDPAMPPSAVTPTTATPSQGVSLAPSRPSSRPSRPSSRPSGIGSRWQSPSSSSPFDAAACLVQILGQPAGRPTSSPSVRAPSREGRPADGAASSRPISRSSSQPSLRAAQGIRAR